MRWFFAVLVVAVLSAQEFPEHQKKDEPIRLPNGKLQSEEILKEEHAKALKEAGEMKKLVDEFYEDLEKNGPHVVSVQMLKRLDEIEKKAKKIKSRISRN